MSSRAAMRSVAVNDVRALLPVWLAGLVAASVSGLSTTDRQVDLGLVVSGMIHALGQVAFIGATIGLGAQAIGHEYSHRTLGLTLMLPMERRRLWSVKLAVIAALVVPLAAYGSTLGLFGEMPALPWLSAGVALCLAPLLTMLCRGPLAGAVFSASAPGFLLIGVMIGTGTGFDSSAAAERAAREAWAWLMIPALAGCAVLGWRLFMRLEWIDVGMKQIHLPGWARASRQAAPRHSFWRLVKKELRLQQMAFALTALYVAVSGLVGLLRAVQTDGTSGVVALAAASTIYWLCLPVLVGSLSTAEERHLGTLTWQLQLPTSAWKQWAAKAGTVFVLALLAGVGAPLVVGQVLLPEERPNLEVALVVGMFTTATSMYISSLCTSGVRAALASLAAIPLTLWLILMSALALSQTRFQPAFWSGREAAWLALLSIVVITLLALAFANHRPEPPATRRILQQVVPLAGLIAVGVIVIQSMH